MAATGKRLDLGYFATAEEEEGFDPADIAAAVSLGMLAS